jgi:pimeloyl-ACP methyl ester carboxylesterase
MGEKLLIIHGYSDGSTSFKSLRDFFTREAGFAKDDVFLLDYSSMDDDAVFKDFADKLDADYERHLSRGGETRINVACHSTGALVVRAWLALRRERQRELGMMPDCPVKRILMFAPANFGSDLATMGQSFLGKIRSTFFNSNAYRSQDFLESGKHVLQGLEPASPFQWALSAIDLEREDYFGPQDDPDMMCFPFVFAAGDNYAGTAQAKLISKRCMPGTDGTVRICGTSLNTRKVRIEFLKRNEPAEYSWIEEKKFSDIPFSVFKDFNHGSIVEAVNWKGVGAVGPRQLVLDALKVDTLAQYVELGKRFSKTMVANYKAMDRKHPNRARYQQFFFRVRDDTDAEVKDFWIDFYVQDADGKLNVDLTARFDKEFETHFYKHSADDACRALLLKCDAMKGFARRLKKLQARLVFDVEGSAPVPNVWYEKGHFVVYDGSGGESENDGTPSFLYPNTTTLVDVVLNRRQSAKLLHLVDNELKPIPEPRRLQRREKPTGRGVADLI